MTIVWKTRCFGLILALLVITCLAPSVPAQIRPVIIDSGTVNVAPSATKKLNRQNIGPTRATKAAYSVLIVLTDPKDADIAINGEPEGKATDGKFKKEFPIGKKCVIEVSAGPDYEAFKKTVQIKPAPEIVEAAMTYKYGSVKVFPALDKVKLSLDGSEIPAANVDVDKANQSLTINRIPPGQHQITYDVPEYVLYKRSFQIEAGSEETWNFIPQKAVSDLSVTTNPDTTVYIDGVDKGKTPADGVLKVPDIKLGQHQIKLVKDGFEEYAENDNFEFQKIVPLAKKLVPIPTSAEFSDDFDVPNLSKWQPPPAGWTMKSGRLFIENAPAIGYPKKIVYRDFEMNFDLRLVNSGGAAWAVRIKDPNNYYLFYLSGANGLFPNRFVTYIVKDGKFDPNSPVSSVPVLVPLKAGDEYSINIKAKDNVIEQSVTPTTTGMAVNLGAFKDPDNLFQYGDVGFRTVAKENFSVDDLYVQPR